MELLARLHRKAVSENAGLMIKFDPPKSKKTQWGVWFYPDTEIGTSFFCAEGDTLANAIRRLLDDLDAGVQK